MPATQTDNPKQRNKINVPQLQHQAENINANTKKQQARQNTCSIRLHL